MSHFGTKLTHCRVAECPLLGVKRTSQRQAAKSAFDPLRKSTIQARRNAQDPSKTFMLA
jgi:hypothetical protein